MGISIEQLREQRQNHQNEIVDRNGAEMKITRVDHECANRSCKDKHIPKGSPAWVLKFSEDKYDETEAGVKPLAGKKYETRYTHYPDCDSPELAPTPKLPPEDKQGDLF